MPIRFHFVLAFLASAGFASADVVTVTFSSQNPGGGLGTPDGLDLPTGSLVRLGYFDFGGSGFEKQSILDSQNDIGLLDEFFTVLSEVMVGFFDGKTFLDETGDVTSTDPGKNQGVPGAFTHSVTFDPVPLGHEGKQLTLWAFNADLVATASAHGIFSDADWITPASLPLNIDLATVDPGNSDDLYVGTSGPEVSGTVGGDLNKLIPAGAMVPEPSSALLLLMGLGGLLRRRRT